MPTLTWDGKEEAVVAAAQVSYHLLEEDAALGYGDADAGNVIVQGDNLAALKALLPYYKGRVRCIYAVPCSDLRARLLSLPCISSQICTRTAC